MHMLNKRTNILFDDKTFNYLVVLAQKEETSVGELVRKAVVKVYLRQNSSKKAKAIDNILRIRKKIKPVSVREIKEYINYGRRY